jgi:hypothetical protein
MKTYKNIIVLMLVTLAVIAAIFFGLSYAIDIKPSLTLQEKRFTRFSYEKMEIAMKKPIAVSSVKNPLESIGGQEKDYPSEALADIIPPDKAGGAEQEKGKGKGQKLSLILIKDRTKLAIVNGVVVKEGDLTNMGRVKKINKDGILLKDDQGEKWLKIE